jgi:hypothetical protein
MCVQIAKRRFRKLAAEVAIASEVGEHNSEPFREAAGDFVPDDMRLGIAM